VSFTNPTSIALRVDAFDLLVESHQEKAKFSVEMFPSGGGDTPLARSFTVPAHARDFKLRLGFTINACGKFKIIGN